MKCARVRFAIFEVFTLWYHQIITLPPFRIFLEKCNPLFPFTNYTFQDGWLLRWNCKHKEKQKAFISNYVNKEAQKRWYKYKKNETERVLARFKQWLAITYGGVFLNFFVTIMAREKVQKHSSIDDDWSVF